MSETLKPLNEMSDDELLELYQQISGRASMYRTEALIVQMFQIRAALCVRFTALRTTLERIKEKGGNRTDLGEYDGAWCAEQARAALAGEGAK